MAVQLCFRKAAQQLGMKDRHSGYD
jgi:hypothetical protein